MTHGRYLLAGLLCVSSAARAGADDRPDAASAVSADKVVAVVAGDDVRHATLVGPSGQVYEPDGAGAWVRHAAGGVAADVTGAARVDGDLVVAGHATPLYRDDGGVWFTTELGADGKTVLGTGPTPSVAIGRDVFVRAKGKAKGAWSRLGTLPAKASLLWASGKDAYAATDAGLYRLRGGGDAAKVGAAPVALAGANAWAIGSDGLTELGAGRSVPATIDGAAVTIVAAAGASGDVALTVIADNGGKLVLAHTHKGALERIDDVPGTGAVAALVIDHDGGALVAFRDGTVAVRRAGVWSTGQVSDALPPAKAGAGPSHSAE